MKVLKFLIFGSAILFSFDAWSDEELKVPTPNDFAFGITLESMKGEGFYTFNVTEDVYRGVTQSDLTDSRVFNGAGSVVQAEVSAVKDLNTTTSSKTITLPLFPIEGRVKEGQSSASVNVSQDSSGKILSVKVDQRSAANDASGSRKEYLADLRNINEALGTFEITWKGGEGRLLPVEALRSDDLKNFRPYCAGVLAKLEFQGGIVSETTLKCGEQRSKFIKFSFPGDDDISLESVKAKVLTVDTQPPPSSSFTLDAIGTGQNGTVFLYDSHGLFPVHEVSVKFSDPNMLLEISVSSRPSIEDVWRELVKFNGYNLTIDGLNVHSGSRTLPSVVSDRYWKVETKHAEVRLSKAPALELRWRPHQVYVLPSGSPPFTFAYGSREFKGNSHSVSRVKELMGKSGATSTTINLKAPHELGGEKLISEDKDQKRIVEWRKWVLWGLLAIVLSFVLIMALRLSRELKE